MTGSISCSSALTALGFGDRITGLQLSEEATLIMGTRHPPTFRSEEGKRIQGHIDDERSKLTPQGIEDAEKFADVLVGKFDGNSPIIVTSDLSRCRSMAEITTKKFHEKKGELAAAAIPAENIYRELREFGHGKFDDCIGSVRTAICTEFYERRKKAFDQQGQTLGQNWKWLPPHPLTQMEFPEGALSEQRLQESPLETASEVCERTEALFNALHMRYPGKAVLACTSGALLSTIAVKNDYAQRGIKEALPLYYEKGAGIPGTCTTALFVLDKNRFYYLGTINLLEQLANKV